MDKMFFKNTLKNSVVLLSSHLVSFSLMSFQVLGSLTETQLFERVAFSLIISWFCVMAFSIPSVVLFSMAYAYAQGKTK
jgi:hypothetical protein